MSVGLGTITVPTVGRPASTRSCVLLVAQRADLVLLAILYTSVDCLDLR
jgi:hypothetical protein